MRDLEQGAFKAVTSFNRQTVPPVELDDPVVAAWIRCEHPDARRLVMHAKRNYDVFFRLTFSHRPWTHAYHSGTRITGSPGFLWHAVFDLHGDGFEVANLWNDYAMTRSRLRSGIVYLCTDSPTTVDISFPAVDDPQTVADLIGDSFDAVLNASRYGWREGSLGDGFEKWAERASGLDPRVQVLTAWSVDESTTPITLFRTGSGTGLGSPF